jgi:hypothetical protein
MSEPSERLPQVIDRAAARLSKACFDGCEHRGDPQEMKACLSPPCRCREAVRLVLGSIAIDALAEPVLFAMGDEAIKISALPHLPDFSAPHPRSSPDAT